MADLIMDHNFEVVMRRFGATELSGRDLREIRRSVLGWNSARLCSEWNVSRSHVTRMENSDSVDPKTRDAYRGLILRHYMQGVE